MTTEAFNPPSPITIATAGPHAIPFPYNVGAVRAGVENLTTGQITDLILGTDFTVTPAYSEESGDLTLSGPAFAAHTGKKLHIMRQTPEVQGWVGTQGSREKGLERGLDRVTRRVQELSRIIVGAVGGFSPLKRFTPMPGRLIIFDAEGQPMNGPDATDIAQAQTNAAIALAAADAASDAEANAMAWAGSINSTFLQTSARRCTLGGTANAITLTTGGSVVSVVAGQRFRALATAANTGAATLTIDALAAVAILTPAGGAVPANFWAVGQELEFTYDGSAWRVSIPTNIGAIGPLATTSGTEVDFIGIPSWAREITLTFDGVSHNFAAAAILVRLGTSSGIEATGYQSKRADFGGSLSSASTSFDLGTNPSTEFFYGHMKFTRPETSQNVWIASGVIQTTGGGGMLNIAGVKTLGAALDRIRLSVSAGTFDAGRATVTYR